MLWKSVERETISPPLKWLVKYSSLSPMQSQWAEENLQKSTTCLCHCIMPDDLSHTRFVLCPMILGTISMSRLLVSSDHDVTHKSLQFPKRCHFYFNFFGGLATATISIASSMATVSFQLGILSLGGILATLSKYGCGFTFKPFKKSSFKPSKQKNHCALFCDLW